MQRQFICRSSALNLDNLLGPIAYDSSDSPGGFGEMKQFFTAMTLFGRAKVSNSSLVQDLNLKFSWKGNGPVDSRLRNRRCVFLRVWSKKRRTARDITSCGTRRGRCDRATASADGRRRSVG